MDRREVHFLLVEDDDVDAMGVERAFAELRIANPLTRVKDGVEALELLRGNQHGQPIGRPHLILLDLNLPRMNGIELLRALRDDVELRRSIVFVFSTSRTEEDRIAAYDLNVAGYIVKSDAANGLLSAILMLDHYWRVVEFP